MPGTGMSRTLSLTPFQDNLLANTGHPLFYLSFETLLGVSNGENYNSDSVLIISVNIPGLF